MNLPLQRERGPGGATPEAASMSNLTTDGSTTTLPQHVRITGEVFVDLTDVDEHKARNRVYYALTETPAGACVVLYVGPLAVNFEVLPMVWEHGQHVDIKVTGHAFAVARWVDALRNGLGVVA